MKNLFFYSLVLYAISNLTLASEETNAKQLYEGCKKYSSWIDRDFTEPVDAKTLFIMGKCKGVIETLGKTMYTLCLERRRNLNIPKLITADLGNMRTRKLIKEFVMNAEQYTELASISAYTFLLHTFSKGWPCN